MSRVAMSYKPGIAYNMLNPEWKIHKGFSLGIQVHFSQLQYVKGVFL